MHIRHADLLLLWQALEVLLQKIISDSFGPFLIFPRYFFFFFLWVLPTHSQHEAVTALLSHIEQRKHSPHFFPLLHHFTERKLNNNWFSKVHVWIPQQNCELNSDFPTFNFILPQAPVFPELLFLPSSLVCAAALTDPAMTVLELLSFWTETVGRKTWDR